MVNITICVTLIVMSSIEKSTRHQKIIGDLGENLICNWLSRSGFEVCIVDHTGIDIIAYNKQTGERLGITVKSRTRMPETEDDPVNILKAIHGDRKKLLDACNAFSCSPWLAIYVECSHYAEIYMTSLDHYDSEYRGNTDRNVEDWKMTKKYKSDYARDPGGKNY